MKVITITNRKGGVSKTTTAFELINVLRKKGYRVLGIDADSQHNLTDLYNLYDEKKENINRLLTNDFKRIDDIIENDLITSTIYLPIAEDKLNKTGTQLKDVLKRTAQHYDFIVIDLAPTYDRIQLNGIIAADYVVISTTTNYLAFNGTTETRRLINSVRKKQPKSARKNFILLTQFQPNLIISKQIKEFYEDNDKNVFKDNTHLLKSVIHNANDIQKSQALGKSIFEFNKKCKAAQDYINFTNELLKEISKDK